MCTVLQSQDRTEMIAIRTQICDYDSLGEPPVSSVTWRHSTVIYSRVQQRDVQERLNPECARAMPEQHCCAHYDRGDGTFYVPSTRYHSLCFALSRTSTVFCSFIIILSLVLTFYSEQARFLVIKLRKLYVLFYCITKTF